MISASSTLNREDLQLIKGMIELENHYFAIPNEITDSAKDHQCMTEPLDERLMRDFTKEVIMGYCHLNRMVNLSITKGQTLCTS